MRSCRHSLAVLATVLLIAACSGSAPTDQPTPTPDQTEPPSPSVSPSPPTSGAIPSSSAAADGLVLLASDATKGNGLWVYAAPGGWRQEASLPTADAVASSADGVIVGNAEALEDHQAGSLSTANQTTHLKWPSSGDAPRLRSVALSTAGQATLAVETGNGISYAIADGTGNVSSLEAAPSPPFTPLVGWLDRTRRLVLSTDGQQISHLAVHDGPGSYEPLDSVSGCRWFAVSTDGATVAAVTESELYVAPTPVWLAGNKPTSIARVASGSVIWGLSFDHGGRRLAALMGTVADDGTVSRIHDIVYELMNGIWQQALDIAVPLPVVVGQAWAG